MKLIQGSCGGFCTGQASLAFACAQHKFRGLLLENEPRMTRRRHRSCVDSSAAAARAGGGVHGSDGGEARGRIQGETVIKKRAPVLGWSARMGTKKLKQVNVSFR